METKNNKLERNLTAKEIYNMCDPAHCVYFCHSAEAAKNSQSRCYQCALEQIQERLERGWFELTADGRIICPSGADLNSNL